MVDFGMVNVADEDSPIIPFDHTHELVTLNNV